MYARLRALFLVSITATALSVIFLTSNGSTRPKTILYYTAMFSSKDMYLGSGSRIFDGCPYSNCFATNNRSLLPVEHFDAVMFHAREYYKREDFTFPAIRRAEQVYIMLDLEPPIYNFIEFMNDYPDFFNWTMTYRLDSDVPRPYGYFHYKATEYQLPSVESIESRKKKIAWFVSRCKSESKRESLVKQLSALIPVDIYGKCGKFKCERNVMEECNALLENNYKFYLSFENSICDEYVTEKLYKMMTLNIVPVVYGGANYKELFPEHSFIDVRDFKDVRELADYLIFLDQNTEEYLKYFEWKYHYVVMKSEKRALCTMCEKLSKPITPKSYHDIVEWWYGPNGDRCTKVNDTFLFRKV